MGSCIPFDDDEPFSERVKKLKNQELLEIWEETQHIESMLQAEISTAISISPDYEKVIVNELQRRSSRQCLAESHDK